MSTRLSWIVALLAGALAYSAPATAERLPAGLDILEPVMASGSNGFSHLLLRYDRQIGKGGLVRADQYAWSRDWTQIQSYLGRGGRTFILFYARGRGEALVYRLKPNGFELEKRIHAYKGWRKTWDLIVPYRSCILFYSRREGIGSFYRLADDGKVGAHVSFSKKWSKTWTSIQPVYHKSAAHLLFYDRGRGRGLIHRLKGDCKLGRKTYDSSGWRKTWRTITPAVSSTGFVSAAKQIIIFYDAGRGEGEVYRFDLRKGRLGKRIERRSGWRKTWDEINYLSGDNGRKRVHFYDRETGAVNVYRLNADGTFGKRLE